MKDDISRMDRGRLVKGLDGRDYTDRANIRTLIETLYKYNINLSRIINIISNISIILYNLIPSQIPNTNRNPILIEILIQNITTYRSLLTVSLTNLDINATRNTN